MGFVTDDLETMLKIIESQDWQELHEKLQEYITGYRQKIVNATSRFQLF